MVDIMEAVAGTVFLSPVVFAAVIGCGQNPSVVISIAGILALPVGWLVHTFSRFCFTFKGRYEHFLTMQYVREKVTIKWDKDKQQCTVDLSGALPKSKNGTFAATLSLSKSEFETIFDPYISLKESRILFWESYRAKQAERGEDLPFAEGIENMFFFDVGGLADFIRSAAANYHTYLAVGWAFLFGSVFAFGLTLSLNADAFNGIVHALWRVTLASFVGAIVCAGVVGFLVWAAWKQSCIRKNEAVANEYLLIKLMLDKKNENTGAPQADENARGEKKQTKKES